MSKYFVIILYVIFAANLLFADRVINRIIAVVNGEVITSYDLKKEMKNFSLYAQNPASVSDPKFFLQKLIDEILLKEEAERLKITVSDKEVEKRIDAIKKQQNLSDDKFKKLLEVNGITLEELKDRIRTNIKITRLLKLMVYDKVIVTPDEIKQYYIAHKNQYNPSKKIALKIIIMKDKDKLFRLKKRIIAGDISFENAAKKFSIGPGASRGGELGVISWDDLKDEFKENLKDLKEGDISPVFELNGVYAILFVEKILAPQHISLDKVKDQIRNILYQRKVGKMFEKYITGLRKKAVVELKI